jgi:UDP-N-acetylglucosamine--N-acetylmuramyl-(pentapeptide) pyrophosphoryl-undecaprenol N-acetylglucosamine transferase
VAAEAAELIVESELTEDRLLSALQGMLRDGDWLAAMGERARGLAHPNAVEEIGTMVVGISRT